MRSSVLRRVRRMARSICSMGSVGDCYDNATGS